MAWLAALRPVVVINLNQVGLSILSLRGSTHRVRKSACTIETVTRE